MVRSIWCGFRPRPTDSEPCGSKSTSSTLRPNSASEAPRLIVVVVLPTPPFWLHIEITRAWVGPLTGAGSGKSGTGRPVGPSTSGASATAATSAGAVDVSTAGANGSGWVTGASASTTYGAGGVGTGLRGGMAGAVVPW